MMDLIKKTKEKFPNHKILLTTPQETKSDSIRHNLGILDRFIDAENAVEPRIGTIDYRNSAALSRAIQDASFILTQDTGLAHIAYHRRGLLGEDARPEVISLSFQKDASDWSGMNQPFISGVELKNGALSESALLEIDKAFAVVSEKLPNHMLKGAHHEVAELKPRLHYNEAHPRERGLACGRQVIKIRVSR